MTYEGKIKRYYIDGDWMSALEILRKQFNDARRKHTAVAVARPFDGKAEVAARLAMEDAGMLLAGHAARLVALED